MVTPKELIDKEISQHLVDSNRYLYHYTKLNTGIEHILYNGTLRMSPFFNVNDPIESKNKSFGVSYSAKDLIPENELFGFNQEEIINEINSILANNYMPLSQINEEANKLLLHDCKVICFSRDSNKLHKVAYPDHIHHRGYCRPRMWAQYAENHRGFCFVFDKKELDIQLYSKLKGKGKILKGNVQYTNVLDSFRKKIKHLDGTKIKKLGLREFLVDYHFKILGKELFFKKTIDWSEELEYRWVLISNTNEEYEYIPFERSLKEIYVGINFPKVYEGLLHKLNEEYRARIFRITIHEGVLRKNELLFT